jgi:hypothetical protein
MYFSLKPEEKQAETLYLFFSLKRKPKTLKTICTCTESTDQILSACKKTILLVTQSI